MKRPDELNSVEWASTNRRNLELAVAQYEKRFAETMADYRDLDGKARWVLGVALPISAAIAGYLYANTSEVDVCGLVGLTSLAIMVAAGAVFSALSITLQNYVSAGITPRDSVIADWAEYLVGDANERKIFHGMRIIQIAKAIRTNSKSNARKSSRLRWGINLSVYSLPISGINLLVCFLMHRPEIPLACTIG